MPRIIILIFLYLLASTSFAATVWYSSQYPNDLFATPEQACQNHANKAGVTYSHVTQSSPFYTCYRKTDTGYSSLATIRPKEQAGECWYPDYKIVQQSVKSQVKKTICIQINNVMCKYTGNPDPDTVVNDYFTTVFSSVSKTPDPGCQEELVNPPCDPKDPYGGCYTPPNQQCTRHFDGSILCPDNEEPPIQKGCNGADYCNRPSGGCGTGYVSGTWNGQRICIKTNSSSGGSGSGGDGSGSGGDGSGSGGDGSGSGGDGSGSGGNGSGSGDDDSGSGGDGTDYSSLLKAIKTSVDRASINITEAVDYVTSTLGGKIDKTNQKLDQVNQNLDVNNNKLSDINNRLNESNSKHDTTNDYLSLINNKLSNLGSGDPSDPNNTSGVDLSYTNNLLTEIRDGIDSIKNVFSDEGKGELEQIGQPSNDSRYLNAEANAQSAVNALANKLTFGSSACVSDFEIQLPIFGSINIALSQWCSLLALIKILFQLVVLLTCLRMLDATVRTI